MRLNRLRADWEQLGAEDAYWAVLTDPAMSGGAWNVEEFYASGVSEVDDLMSYVDQVCPDLARGDALDFGCGPGRVTHALARRFDHATGVDISAPMIELAKARPAEKGNCDFVCNSRDDLSVFGDASFDFVYSHLVLQHIPTGIARRYISEFVRLLRPDGLALFQVPEAAPNRMVRLRRELAYQVRSRRDYRAKVRIFGVARDVVVDDITRAGGTIRQVVPDLHSHGGPDASWWYWVGKD